VWTAGAAAGSRACSHSTLTSESSLRVRACGQEQRRVRENKRYGHTPRRALRAEQERLDVAVVAGQRDSGLARVRSAACVDATNMCRCPR
jgi:hypothetical protein